MVFDKKPELSAASRPLSKDAQKAQTERALAEAAERRRAAEATKTPQPKELGGQQGPEPTRYGDWEHKGRCTDF